MYEQFFRCGRQNKFALKHGIFAPSGTLVTANFYFWITFYFLNQQWLKAWCVQMAKSASATLTSYSDPVVPRKGEYNHGDQVKRRIHANIWKTYEKTAKAGSKNFVYCTKKFFAGEVLSQTATHYKVRSDNQKNLCSVHDSQRVLPGQAHWRMVFLCFR